jgi:hypothetical protein
MVRTARAARSTTTLRKRIGTGYEVLLTTAIVGGLGIQAGRRLLAAASSGSPAAADPRVIGWLLVALTLLLAGLALRGLAAIGPLFAGPATQTWMLSTPVSRCGLLTWWYRWTLVASAAVGFGYGVLAGRLGGTGLTEFFLCAATGALFGVALSAWSIHQQATESSAVRRLGAVAVVAGLLLALLVGALRLADRVLPGVPWLWPAAASTLVLATAGIWAGARIRGSISRAALSEGAALAGATSVAVNWFDSTLLTGLLTQRRWLRVAAVRSTRLRPGSRVFVLLRAESRRLVRSRWAAMAWATLVVLPYPLAAVISPIWMPVVQIVGATLAVDRLAGGLRTVSRSAAIRRSIGGSDRAIRLAHLVIPACGALLWSALTLPVVWSAGPWLGVLYPAVTATLVVYRLATRRAMDYNLAGTMDPTHGVLPIGLIIQLFRGPDLLLLLVAVRILLG